MYAGYIIFQDNPPKQIKKTDALKLKDGNKILSKKAINQPGKKNSSKIKKQQAALKKNRRFLLKANGKLQPANKSVTVGKNKIQNIIKVKTQTKNTELNSTEKFKDSIKALPKNDLNISNVGIVNAQNDSEKKAVSKNNDIKILENATVKKTGTETTNLKIKKGLQLGYGLQWNINVPLFGLKRYFTGTNGKYQPQNFIIPGFWISKVIGPNEIILLLKPEQQYFTGNKVVASAIKVNSISRDSLLRPDTIFARQNTIVIKTNTFYAGLQYNFKLNENWSIGAGVNFNWQLSALVNKQTMLLSNNIFLSDSLYSLKKTMAEWKYLHQYFTTAKLEAGYHWNKFTIGGTVHVPVTNIFLGNQKTSRPLNSHIFLRRQF